jgi:hypothetical protein
MVPMMPTVYPAASPGSPRFRHRLFHRLDRELRGERAGHLHLSQDQITQVCHQKVYHTFLAMGFLTHAEKAKFVES